ncbi:hypothetical protein [Streptomyces sp. DSM 118148]|uniref:hypothetical protein n=1 Tax=Streptomyces sp. DSM 118148 TaxID=3448667 RepID=UPI00403FD1C9
MTMAVPGGLTGCGGDDGPSTPEKEPGGKCAGRVAADSVDLRPDEETTAKAIAAWHPDGQGQCFVSARGKDDRFEPFTLAVQAGE